MPDQQPKKRRKRNAPKIARKLRNKHSRPSLPSAPPDDVANDPALADNEPSPPEDDLPSPILIAPSKPSKDQIIDDLKKQKKSAQNRGYYLEKVVEKKDVTIDDQKEKVKSLVKNEIRLSLLEAAAQARAAELKANAEIARHCGARVPRHRATPFHAVRPVGCCFHLPFLIFVTGPSSFSNLQSASMPKYHPLFFQLIVSIFYLLSSTSATHPSSLVVSAFPPWLRPGAPPFRPAANSVPVAVMPDQQPKKRKMASDKAYQKLHVSNISSYILCLLITISLTYLNYRAILYFCRKII